MSSVDSSVRLIVGFRRRPQVSGKCQRHVSILTWGLILVSGVSNWCQCRCRSVHHISLSAACAASVPAGRPETLRQERRHTAGHYGHQQVHRVVVQQGPAADRTHPGTRTLHHLTLLSDACGGEGELRLQGGGGVELRLRRGGGLR